MSDKLHGEEGGQSSPIRFDSVLVERIQRDLDGLLCPPPEDDLSRLCTALSALPQTEQSATLQVLALDVEDFIAQIRWQIGHAVLVLPTLPELETPTTEVEEIIQRAGMLGSTLLILRNYTREPHRVMYADLSEPRRGGTVGGWVFHMLVDNAVFRSVAALDRIARILWIAADLPEAKVYFRSGKLRRIHERLGCRESASLVEHATSQIVTAIVEYRDGYAHTRKQYSDAAGSNPAATWTGPRGEWIVQDRDAWDPPHLLDFSVRAYRQLVSSLVAASHIVQRRWPPPAAP